MLTGLLVASSVLGAEGLFVDSFPRGGFGAVEAADFHQGPEIARPFVEQQLLEKDELERLKSHQLVSPRQLL